MKYRLLVLMFVVGSFNALQAPVNRELSRHTGLIGAVTAGFLIGSMILTTIYLLSPKRKTQLRRTEPWQYAAGPVAMVFILTTMFVVDRLGAAVVIAVSISAQLFAGLFIDRMGLFRVRRIPISTSRIVGACLLILGMILITIPRIARA